jgi:Mrp family chromosome partitioning ATPase
VLLVARAGKTTVTACKQSVKQLRHVGANVLGVVINDVPSGRSAYNYAYYEYYTYTYSEDTNQEQEETSAGRRGLFRRRAKAKVAKSS